MKMSTTRSKRAKRDEGKQPDKPSSRTGVRLDKYSCPWCPTELEAFPRPASMVKHLMRHEHTHWTVCTRCGTKKDLDSHLGDFAKPGKHSCAGKPDGYTTEKITLTRARIQRAAEECFGVSPQAFAEALGEVFVRPEPRVPSSAAGAPGQIAGPSAHTRSRGRIRLQPGEPAPSHMQRIIPSGAWLSRYPLGEYAHRPSILPHLRVFVADERVQVFERREKTENREWYRVTACDHNNAYLVTLMAPTSVGSPGLMFRDCPWLDPVPVMRPKWLSKRGGKRATLEVEGHILHVGDLMAPAPPVATTSEADSTLSTVESD
jgi:hypothetical protein